MGRLVCTAFIAALLFPYVAPHAQGGPDTVFEENCVICHDNPVTRAPPRQALHAMSPDFIVEALSNGGLMQAPGSNLSQEQRVAVAEFLTGRKLGSDVPMSGRCASAAAPLTLDGPSYNGWGAGPENWRFQHDPGLSPADLRRLSVKWAFGFPGVVVAFGQPTVVGGRVFVGSQNRHVYALDAATGCYYWDYTTSSGVRTAVTVARVGDKDLAFFGDRGGRVYAVDAVSGNTVWKVKPDQEPAVVVTGAPMLFENRLYVPISVGDDSKAIDPKYECCMGRGAVVTLDAATGETIWQTFVLPEPTKQGTNAAGTQH